MSKCFIIKGKCMGNLVGYKIIKRVWKRKYSLTIEDYRDHWGVFVHMKSGIILSKPIYNSKSIELISYHLFTIYPSLLLPLAWTYFYPSNSPASLNFNTCLLFVHEEVLISQLKIGVNSSNTTQLSFKGVLFDCFLHLVGAACHLCFKEELSD